MCIGQPPPRGYPKLVGNEIARAEALPRLIITANDIIVDTYLPCLPLATSLSFVSPPYSSFSRSLMKCIYRALMPAGSEGDFTRVLELKGVRREEKNEIIQRYNAAIASMPANTSGNSVPHISSPATVMRSSTPPLTSNPLSLSSSGASFLRVKKLIPDSLLNLNKNSSFNINNNKDNNS
jgi:hypothetical protein